MMKRKKKGKAKVTCPYCGAYAVLRDAGVVYGEGAMVEKLYVCSNYPACDEVLGNQM